MRLLVKAAPLSSLMHLVITGRLPWRLCTPGGTASAHWCLVQPRCLTEPYSCLYSAPPPRQLASLTWPLMRSFGATLPSLQVCLPGERPLRVRHAGQVHCGLSLGTRLTSLRHPLNIGLLTTPRSVT